MKKEMRIILIFISFLILSIFGIVSAAGSNVTMTVEANILGFANKTNVSDVSIEVPEHIFLGNVTKSNPFSDEIKIYINNTGRLPISVTPQLKDNDEIIFSYLSFRTTKTSNGTEVPLTRIGNYSLFIDKPSAGSSFRSKYCYMSIDLTNFNGEIKEDLIGYKTDIIFIAMPT